MTIAPVHARRRTDVIEVSNFLQAFTNFDRDAFIGLTLTLITAFHRQDADFRHHPTISQTNAFSAEAGQTQTFGGSLPFAAQATIGLGLPKRRGKKTRLLDAAQIAPLPCPLRGIP